jgi:hypothetical protein
MVAHDLSFILKDLPSPPTSGSFLEQLKVAKFFQYVGQNSGNTPVASLASTNPVTAPGPNMTNLLLHAH